MHEAIRARIERHTGIADLVEVLAERLDSDDLQSLLLAVMQRRAGRVAPAELLQRREQSRFLQAGGFDPLRLLELEAHLLRNLPPGFRRVALSPLAPLGVCSRLATVHQNKVVSTCRGQEIASDPTNALALECASARRSGQEARLAASQRVVRAQALPRLPGFYAHFSILGLASAARWSRAFAEEALVEHWSYYVEALAPLRLRILYTDLGGLEGVLLGAARRLQGRAEVVSDPSRESGRGYYIGACYKVWAGAAEIGDGGFTDWTQKLLGNRREALLIGGLGLDRLLTMPVGPSAAEPDQGSRS